MSSPVARSGVLAENEVAFNHILIFVLNVNDKLSMTYNVSRLVDLREDFSPEINFFLRNVFDVT
jgi:hypothetical protein